MASVVIAGDTSGTCTLQANAAAGTTVLDLPTTSGTLVSTTTPINASVITSGTLLVSYGGTGANTLTGVLKGNGTSAFTAAVAGTDFVAPGGALGTPSSGTLTNCTGYSASNLASGTLPAARLPAGSVLQVVSTFTQTQSSFTGNDTWQSYTSLNTSITPTSSSNKILIIVSFGAFGCSSGTTTCALQLLRSGTPIGVGSTTGSQKAATFKTIQWSSDGNHGQGGVGFTFLDSPSTTSSTTYSFNINPQNAFTWFINRNASGGTGGESYSSTTGSSMTLMEIAG
jgi:hypothetical protein